jgi:predicted membrane protein
VIERMDERMNDFMTVFSFATSRSLNGTVWSKILNCIAVLYMVPYFRTYSGNEFFFFLCSILYLLLFSNLFVGLFPPFIFSHTNILLFWNIFLVSLKFQKKQKSKERKEDQKRKVDVKLTKHHIDEQPLNDRYNSLMCGTSK